MLNLILCQKVYSGRSLFSKHTSLYTETFWPHAYLCSQSNFLYSDGITLLAHGHHGHDPVLDKLIYPGLQYLQVDCEKDSGMTEVKEGALSLQGRELYLTLFASVPLSSGDGKSVPEGEVINVTKCEMIL